MKSNLLKIVFFLCTISPIQAQELLPFVENYNKSNFQGDNQTWNVVQGNDNAMYFANNHYLLRYDGVMWEKYTLPNKTIIRSIMIEGDKIYSGSYKEFGYWYRKEGKMHYVSITKNLQLFDEKDNEEIWKIFKFDGAIYFQSFNSVFIYAGKKIQKIRFPFLISYCFVIDKNLYVASVKKGVFKMNSTKLTSLKGWDNLENSVIHAIEKYKNSIYIFTKKRGVFIADNKVLKPWDSPLNEVLKKTAIITAKFIRNNKLVIGTGNKGIFIIDLSTNLYQNISRKNVLMNNSILSIGSDKENDLWLGLDNGIAHIEVNSPISIFYDSSGILGSVYSVATTKKGYLIASNHGIFEYNEGKFLMVPNTQGQAWNITKIGNQYLIGHNDGTFLYDDGIFSKINNTNGGWNVSKSSINSTYFQSTYNGILVYDDTLKLHQNKMINSLAKPIKYVVQNKKNEIWAADNYRGLYRIVYNDNYKTKKIENITQESKIKNDFEIKIFEFRNENLFLINNSWYTYNSLANKLEKNKLFNDKFKNVSDVAAIDENQFVVLKNGVLYYIYADKDQFVWKMIQEKYYKGKLINNNLKIFKDKNNYLLNLDDGFITFQLKKIKKKNLDLKIEAFNNEHLVANEDKIDFNSELKIHVISGVYGAQKPNLFYKLDGIKELVPITNGLIVLNNLNSGFHSIKIYKHDNTNYDVFSSF